jgi:hypothetical protein
MVQIEMEWLSGLFGQKKANMPTAPLKEVVVTNAPVSANASVSSATAPRIHAAFNAPGSQAVGGRRNSRKNRKNRKNSRKNRTAIRNSRK